MSWHGKILGGIFGFFIGGPWGAAAGATLGHAFVDRKNNLYKISRHRPGQALLSPEQAKVVFFTSVFSMLGKMSKVDGKVTKEEIAVVEKFIKEELHLNTSSRLFAIQIFRQSVQSPESFEYFASQFYANFSSQPYLIDLMMDILFRIAGTDGTIQEEEEELLLSAAEIFDYSHSDYERMKNKYINNNNYYYAILNCDFTASNEEIKKQYRKLVNEYHPDKIQAKGLPEGFIKFANEKFVEIQEAYTTIKKERGM
jgi:DnaJ like chaperone protein